MSTNQQMIHSNAVPPYMRVSLCWYYRVDWLFWIGAKPEVISFIQPCAKSNIVIDLVYKTKIQHIAIQGPGPQQEDLYSKSG